MGCLVILCKVSRVDICSLSVLFSCFAVVKFLFLLFSFTVACWVLIIYFLKEKYLIVSTKAVFACVM